MSGTLIEDAANRGLERHSVYTLVLEDQKKVDQISGSRRATALVGTPAGVQLFGDVPLQRHEQYLDRIKPKCAQEPWPPSGLSVPRIGYVDTDVHLKQLEWPSGEGTLQFVSHSEADTRLEEFFAPC